MDARCLYLCVVDAFEGARGVGGDEGGDGGLCVRAKQGQRTCGFPALDLVATAEFRDQVFDFLGVDQQDAKKQD